MSRLYELECCEYALRFIEAFDPFLGAFCVVFLGERCCDCIANASTADEFAANGDFESVDLDCSARLFPEGAEPAGWLVAPGTRKNSVVDDHDPNTRIAMLSPGTNTHDLRVPCRLDDGSS